MGRVLGASTLPFYSQPGTQLLDLLYSAFRAVVGVSEWLIELSVGPSQIKSLDAGFIKRLQLRMFAQAQIVFLAQVHYTFIQASKSQSDRLVSSDSVRPILACMPLVSLTW